MFKFLRRRKPVDIVVRAADLQIGDIVQLTPHVRGTVVELVPLRKLKHIDIKLNKITNEDAKNTTKIALRPELKLIVWR